MKKIFWLLAFVAVIIGIIIIKNNEPNMITEGNNKSIIKIGALLPLSGNMAHTGENVRKAIMHAVNQFNKNPDNIFNYKLIIEDDQMQSAKTVMALRKLISYDGISAVLSLYSQAGKAIQPIVTTEKIIHLSTMYSNTADGIHTFNNLVTIGELAPATLGFINKNKFKNIALLFLNNISAQEILDSITPTLKEVNILFKEYRFNPGERDFNIMVTKLKNAGHDLVVLYGFMPELALAYKVMKQQDIQLSVLGYDTFEVGNFDVSLFDGYFELGVPVNNQAWIESLKLDSSYIADYMYDSINIIMQTYERAGKNLERVPRADEFREVLYEIREYEGITGKSILEDSGQFRSKVHLKKVENGKVIEIRQE